MVFGKKETCSVCGSKLDGLTKTTVADGSICPVCGRICKNSMLSSTSEIRKAWDENHKRFKEFTPDMTISDFGSGYIFVDTVHRLCYLSNSKKPKLEPVVFRFSEVEGFKIERVGQKTVTKTKGGLGRAIIGGAIAGTAGAVVGAATAKTETKQVGGLNLLEVHLNLNGMKTVLTLGNPPLKAGDFFDSMVSVEN